jgi:hypothetical protein
MSCGLPTWMRHEPDQPTHAEIECLECGISVMFPEPGHDDWWTCKHSPSCSHHSESISPPDPNWRAEAEDYFSHF